ncbi:MAG: Foldase protein PrsA [Thermoanaerobacterales bacterium 50_218]|nr:MAG: Foldase protein PrsA [Thermoanaerobacterales bacterium 50_218]
MRVNREKISRQAWLKEVSFAENFLLRVYDIDLQESQARKLRQQVEEEVLRRLVDRVLLCQAARFYGIDVSEAEVEALLLSDQRQSGGEKRFREILRGQGLTLEDYRKKVEENLLISKLWDYLTKEVTVSEEELKSAYKARRDEFSQPEEVKIGHILVKSEDLARSLITALEEGADFQELAVKHSRDPSVSQNKGVIGYIRRDDPLIPESLREAAFSLPPGAFTREPVKSEFGYHIVIVFDRKEGKVATYEEVRQQLYEEVLAEKKNEVFLEYLESLRRHARITTRI